MLSKKQQIFKRLFDFTFALVGLCFAIIPLLILILIASFSTRSFGIFKQERVGQFGQIFVLYKIKSMRKGVTKGHITTSADIRITSFGKFLRNTKLDEFPQLINVLFGSMSFVGPRPDIKGYADKLEGDDRIILSVKPGITGPATLYYSNEAELLAKQSDPINYNNTVIWPHKVEMNRHYVLEWNFLKDLRYCWRSILQVFH
ncbi:sugar transferase [Urechidicola sp. KH5]